VRYPLAALLALAVTALLANHLSVLAIAEWGASQSDDVRRRLGFPSGATPHQSTLQRLFGKLDPQALAQALTAVFRPPATEEPPARGSSGIALDGKAQRGRLAFETRGCPVHALTAYSHEQGVVLAQLPITATGEKAEAELTVAPALLAQLEWRGSVFTGDALFCQRSLCQQVRDAGGDYLLVVKENQPTLHEMIRLLFDPPFAPLPLTDRREALTVDRGHGRQREVRHLVASTDLVGYSDWPGLAQVFRLERRWQQRGMLKREVHYGLTSLPPAAADARRLLALRRGQWQIENGLHYVKDVTFGEDRSAIHVGHGPAVMAVLRDLAVSLLHRAGIRAIAPRLRYHSRHPEAAVAFLTGPSPQNASALSLWMGRKQPGSVLC
jgi:predicted transposase YbfD/YdcC